MFKSLYSGVSGLSANLTNLDVIGNNIANSNTVGFKSGRVTFSEMLTQTIQPASRPVAGGLGGTNPQQVGLGTRVGSIDTNFNQGNFQTTGKKTDIAIQGSGFFMLSDGASRTYTRAGVFGLDSSSYLVSPSTGLKVQGVMADATGILPAGPMSDIYIDPGLVVPAAASTEVQLRGNLDAASDARPTIVRTASLLTMAQGTDLLVDMSGETGGQLDLDVGNQIALNGRDSAGNPLSTNTFEVTSDTTYQDLVDWLNGETAAASFSIDPSGALQMNNTSGGDMVGVSLAVDGKDVFGSNLTIGTVAAGTTAQSSGLRSYADAGDLLQNIYSADGAPLGVDFTDPTASFVLGGRINGEQVDTTTFTVDGTTTLGDLASEIQYALGAYSNPATINDEGQIEIIGEVGLASSIDEISVTEGGEVNGALTDAFSFIQIQQAEDQQNYTMATRVYDSLGIEHSVSFAFEKVPGENEWIWQAEMEGTEVLLSGGSGRIRFDSTGAISSFSFDDNVSALTFQPQAQGEGAENVVLDIDFGEIGALTGLTQFEGEGNLQAIADGYTSGNLVDFAIDQSGVITGIFSNDISMAIAQIGIAQFSNQEGLVREANNTYRLSGNSGQAMETFAGMGNGVTLAPGALETSNVDLAREFTNLVVAQRSFQANSRVISTADQIMQELVNLIR